MRPLGAMPGLGLIWQAACNLPCNYPTCGATHSCHSNMLKAAPTWFFLFFKFSIKKITSFSTSFSCWAGALNPTDYSPCLVGRLGATLGNWASCSPRPRHRLAGPGHHSVARVWNPYGSHHTGTGSSTAPAAGLRAQGGRDQEQLGDKKGESPRGWRPGAGEKDCKPTKMIGGRRNQHMKGLLRRPREDPNLGVSRENPGLEKQRRPRSWEATQSLGLGRKNLKTYSLRK